MHPDDAFKRLMLIISQTGPLRFVMAFFFFLTSDLKSSSPLSSFRNGFNSIRDVEAHPVIWRVRQS